MKFKLFNRSTDDAKTLKKLDKAFIDAAFENRRKEIESLKKYDRGEKEITPRNLRSLVQGI